MAKQGSAVTRVRAYKNKLKTPIVKKSTRIVIKYDAGYSNELFLRGDGGPLSWDKGAKMQNIHSDEWLWESEALFSACEFKVVLNDEQFEEGENHALSHGSAVRYTPRF
jgi:hypothetical protein